MLAIGIVLICLAFGAYVSWSDEEGPGVGAFGGAIVGGIIAVFAVCIVVEASTEHHYAYGDEPESVSRPVALQDDLGAYGEIHGGLFYTSGFVNSNLFYSWYEEVGDGGYVSRSVHEDEETEIVVYEEPSGSSPSVERFKVIDDCTSSAGWAFFGACSDGASHTLYKIHVPEGTIVRETKLNAKSG